MKPRAHKPPAPKKVYNPPKLVKYGEVQKLTRAGGTSTAEGGGRKKPSSSMVKENIVKIGQHPLGIGLYLFDYKPDFQAVYGNGRQFGVMAHEVEAVMPGAVSLDQYGNTVVDYGMLHIEQFTG